VGSSVGSSLSRFRNDASWRLIPLLEGTGAEQMAIDSWLLNQHVKGSQPSILRFYTWSSPTISLGYHQRQFPQHWNNLVWQGHPVEIVRRPTGGRAVLHQGELTYAIVTSAAKGTSRRDTYQRLCQFLIKGWQQLGITLDFGAAGRGYIKNPNCFGTATAADLVTEDGYKLIGSAQVYRGGSVLQHGSMRLSTDAALYEQVFEESYSPPVCELSACVESSIIQALTLAAQRSFEISFRVENLSTPELEAAQTEDWLQTRR